MALDLRSVLVMATSVAADMLDDNVTVADPELSASTTLAVLVTTPGTLLSVPWRTHADFLRVLLWAPTELIYLLLPGMQQRGFGRIVNVASEAGRLGSRGGAVYAAAKAGPIGFTLSIARENARYGVTANAVAPGPIRTPMVERAITAHGETLREDMAALTLMRRLGEAHEVAAAIAFLCSPGASFITGEKLGVSGGMGCGA